MTLERNVFQHTFLKPVFLRWRMAMGSSHLPLMEKYISSLLRRLGRVPAVRAESIGGEAALKRNAHLTPRWPYACGAGAAHFAEFRSHGLGE
jgi:hypothetical protein